MALPNQSSPDETGRRSLWTPGRIVLSLGVVVAISAMGLSSCNSKDAAPTNVPVNRATNTPPARNTAPLTAPVSLPQELRDLTLQTLDGESLKLSNFADQVVVINLWATWCGPCRLEMPDLVKLNQEYKARGLVVLGLATTYNERNDPQQVKDFVSKQNVDYKIIWDDGTLAGPLVQVVGGRPVIPQSFVISRDGRIVKHFSGFNQYQTPQLMRLAVEEALNGKGKA